MRPLEDAPFLDPFTEEFQADPLPIIDRLRARSWLARTPISALVVGREQVHKLLSDPRLQSALLQLTRLQGVNEGQLYELVASALLSIDGADHARIRGLVSRAFTPRAVEPYRPAMRALAEELVERFVGAGECEFMGDFADHYPIEVMCQLLGVPPEDHLRFARWGDALTHVLSLELSLHPRRGQRGCGRPQRLPRQAHRRSPACPPPGPGEPAQSPLATMATGSTRSSCGPCSAGSSSPVTTRRETSWRWP